MAQNDQDDLPTEEQKTPGRFTGPGLVVPLLILAIIAGYLYILGSGPRRITTQQFLEQLKAKNVAEVDIFTRYAVGKFKQPVPTETTAEQGSEKAKREGESPAEPNPKTKTQNPKSQEGESPAEPSAEKKPPEKKSSAKAEEKPDL